MRHCIILSLFFLACGVAYAQNLANSGWPKNHADLHNSGVHTYAHGLRSLDNAQLHQLDPEIYGRKGEGAVAFGADGTAYLSLSSDLNGTRIIKVHPDLSVELIPGFTDISYYSGTAVTDDDKAIFIGSRDFTFYDFQNGANYSVDLRPTKWGLYGPSATIVNGEFYFIDGNAVLRGYTMNGTSIANYTGAYEDDMEARNEFVTPATTGNGIYYYCTGNVAVTNIYAVRMPEAELVWKYNTSNPDLFGVDPYVTIEGESPHLCDTSSVISPDGTVVYQMMVGGIIALDAQTGALKWSKSFTSLADNQTLVSDEWALVSPLINPIDGGVIALVINTTVSSGSRSNESYIFGLSQKDGSVTHSLQLSVPDNIESAPAVTADGVFYFCTYISCHGVDIKSNPWTSLWEISAEKLSIDYSALSISPDGSVWILDDNNNGTFYIGCESGHYIDRSGVCSPCPANTVAFGTSCGFECEGKMMLYHEKASCGCGAGEQWDYPSVGCVVIPDDNDDSSAGRITSALALMIAAIAVIYA